MSTVLYHADDAPRHARAFGKRIGFKSLLPHQLDHVCNARTHSNTSKCGVGTSFVDGACKINEQACGKGTTLIDGVCKINQSSPPCGVGTTWHVTEGLCQIDCHVGTWDAAQLKCVVD